MVRSERMVMEGSLSPLGCGTGVLVNEMVLGCAPAGGLARCAADARLTVSTAASATRPSKRLDAFVAPAPILSLSPSAPTAGAPVVALFARSNQAHRQGRTPPPDSPARCASSPHG